MDEQQRVIAFAKLVNSASDEEFKEQISSFIDVDEFLRFMAANALTANLESFLALGHNYTLYLDPRTNKFQFIPGDLEFSFANLLLFGSPEELMDLDGSGRLYVASWRGGEAAVFVGPNIGFVARVTPKDLVATPFPDLEQASLGELVRHLSAPQSVTRLHAQGEILARGKNPESTKSVLALASDAKALLEGRVAAIFTLKQLDGTGSHANLLKLTAVPAIREFVLRALTDRRTEAESLDLKPFVDALSDASPRVRAQALISLGRLNNPAAAQSILPLTVREQGSIMPMQRPLQNQPDSGRVVPHLAVRALVGLQAIDTCLEALDGPYADGALWAMRYMHDRKAVEGLIKRLGTTRTTELRRGILVTLIRL